MRLRSISAVALAVAAAAPGTTQGQAEMDP